MSFAGPSSDLEGEKRGEKKEEKREEKGTSKKGRKGDIQDFYYPNYADSPSLQ
jgi:hypothetical protein